MNKRLGEATAASVALPVGPFANAQDHSQLNLVPSASGIVPLTIPPQKGRRFLPDSETPSVGTCCLSPFVQAHFKADPGLADPWVLDKLGIPAQELGLSLLERKYRTAHPLSISRPEGRGFPRITGKRLPPGESPGHLPRTSGGFSWISDNGTGLRNPLKRHWSRPKDFTISENCG
jgi:hypothetical protein